MLKRIFFSALLVVTLASSPVHATQVTVDFSGHATNTPIGNTYAGLGLVFSNANFAQCAGGCPPPNPVGYFAFGDAGGTFTADFLTPQSLITFQTVSFSNTLAQAFNASNILVASATDHQGFPVTGQLNQLSGADITRVVFSNSGGGNGPSLTNLTFDVADGAVPEPATWALMIIGFGVVSAAIRRRQAALRYAPA